MSLFKRLTAFALCAITAFSLASCENPGPQDPLTRREKEKIVSEFKSFDNALATDLDVKLENKVSSRGESSTAKADMRIVINGIGDDAEIYTKTVSFVDGVETGYPTEQYFKDGRFYTILHVTENEIYGNCEEKTYKEAFENENDEGEATEESTTSLPLSYEMLSDAKVVRNDDGTLEMSYKGTEKEFTGDIETVITDMTGKQYLGNSFNHSFSAVFEKDKTIKEITYSVCYNHKMDIMGESYTTTTNIVLTMTVNKYGKNVTVPVPERLDECVFIG